MAQDQPRLRKSGNTEPRLGRMDLMNEPKPRNVNGSDVKIARNLDDLVKYLMNLDKPPPHSP